jgi:hypothetical protein
MLVSNAALSRVDFAPVDAAVLSLNVFHVHALATRLSFYPSTQTAIREIQWV